LKKRRFTEEQVVEILREAEKLRVAQVANEHRISEQTLHAWRKRFGNRDVQDGKRLRVLVAEDQPTCLVPSNQRLLKNCVTSDHVG
jgi:transposase-like protein